MDNPCVEPDCNVTGAASVTRLEAKNNVHNGLMYLPIATHPNPPATTSREFERFFDFEVLGFVVAALAFPSLASS